MKSSTCSTSVFLFCALTLSSSANADVWNCSHTDLVREVVIEYPEGGTLPCNVVYKKEMEGFTDQVLWSASNVQGYCEQKAGEFVVKLESWGWDCVEAGDAEVVDVETDTVPNAEPEQVLQLDSDMTENSQSEQTEELQSEAPTVTDKPDADKIR